MSILKPKIRNCSARVAGGTIFSVFILFMPSYLVLYYACIQLLN